MTETKPGNVILIHIENQLLFKNKTVREVHSIVQEARTAGYLVYFCDESNPDGMIVNIAFAPGVPVIVMTEEMFKKKQAEAVAAQKNQTASNLLLPTGMTPLRKGHS